MLGGDVLLPGFGVGEIHRVVVAVGIFVGKTTETMSELMHNDGAERLVLGWGEGVAVVYASTTVFCRVHQYDDVLVGHCHELVVQLLEMKGGEIAVAIERVEM